ncbi:MAG: tRNA nucleotidyltransferase (CCA-adding enzyme) [Chloroflexi bacterium]|nr:MAG: tRNA nucleotidyltransferase (CCA-adding enzyme) [Chloroflexota bacterium]
MKIVSSKIENVLPKSHIQILNAAVELSQDINTDLYLVGGCVRDIMLGVSEGNFDIDLAGSDIDRDFADRLAGKLKGKVKSSSLFGTHKLSVPVGYQTNIEIDLALCRSETYKTPGSLPDVSPGDLFQDLLRRDFSVSAMCIVLRSPEDQDWQWGQLIDPHSGYKDLKNEELRILHKNSFVDDPTRMFRLLRYSGRLGFAIEEETKKLFESSMNWVSVISGERIRHELEKIFEERDIGVILSNCVMTGLLPAFLTQIDCKHLIKFKELEYSGDFKNNTAEFWFGIVGMNANKTEVEYLSKTLNLNSKQREVIRDLNSLNKQLQKHSAQLVSEDPKRSDIYKFLMKYNVIAIQVCAATTSDMSIKIILEMYLSSLMNSHTELSGDDLISLGVRKGPKVGELLNNLLYAKLDGQLPSIDSEMDYIKNYLRNN